MAYAAVSSAGVSSCSRSSGAAFSARSSFRIEATRISQTRCFVSVFLLSYSRLRSSPSTWTCAPFVSVLANSERLPKTTQRCHSVCEMYLSSFLYEDLVASESVVKLRLLLLRTSALLPRKPMRVTLFWYIIVSPFVEFSRCCSGHTGRSLASGPGSQGRRSAFWEGPERSLRGVFCRGLQTCFGRNRDPEGARKSGSPASPVLACWGENAKQKTERRRAPERPRSGDQAKDGIHNGRYPPGQSCHRHIGCRSSPQAQSHSSRHVHRKKGATRHRRCTSGGSRSP